MSDRRRREERQRSRSRSRDRHRRRERSESRERHGRHHRSGREMYSPSRFLRSRSRSRDRSRRSPSRHRESPPHHSKSGHSRRSPYSPPRGHHRSGRERYTPPTYRSNRSRSRDRSRRSLSRDRYSSPHYSRRSPYSPPRGGYGQGAGTSRAGGYYPPHYTSRGSYPADHGAGTSGAGSNRPQQPYYPQHYFGVTPAPGTDIAPLSYILAGAEAELAGKSRPEKPESMIRHPDRKLLPYMTEDRFTNFIKLDVRGIGTLLFYYYNPLISHDSSEESRFVDRWHLFVKVRETGPDTGPGSPNNGYAYVTTLLLWHTLGEDQRLKLHLRRFFFQFTIKDIRPYLADNAELILWLQARHNFSVAREFVDLIPTLWEQPVNNPDEKWFKRQVKHINEFYEKNGVPVAKINEMYEQRKAAQLAIELPERMALLEQSFDDEGEQAPTGSPTMDEMDLFQDDIFGRN